jgi:hypothetical protein
MYYKLNVMLFAFKPTAPAISACCDEKLAGR